MKIFLSSGEGSAFMGIKKILDDQTRADPKLLWNLVSYYYCQKNTATAETLRDNSRLLMVDSGAHSFQGGKKVDWLEYTRRYAAFIREFDRPNVVGYFEMDVDKIIGLDNVVRLRRVLEEESGVPEKIIPVWHNSRGNHEFTEMCRRKQGQVVAISGFAGADIRDSDYASFLKEAWKYGCKLHGLGLTRRDILDRVPFDFTDSSSWNLETVYGSLRTSAGSKVKLPRASGKGEQRANVLARSYMSWMDMQKAYWVKWRKVCNDPF